MKAIAETVLPHSIESVFACVADITRMPLWVSNFSEPRWVPRGNLEKKPVFMGKYHFNGKYYDIAIEVDRLHPPSSLVLRSNSIPFAFVSELSLYPEGRKTRVIYSIRAGSDNAVVKLFIVIFGKVAGRMLRRQLEAELAVLNDILTREANTGEVPLGEYELPV